MVVSRAANTDSFTVTTPSETEIRMTRLFDAPRELVFEAMTKPEHIQQWWGTPRRRLLGPGVRKRSSRWREVALREPVTRRATAAFHGEHKEITAPSRLVFTEIFEDFPDVVSVVTSDFTEENGKTRLTVTVRYPSRDVRDMVIASGMAKGAGISYDRLEDLLATLRR